MQGVLRQRSVFCGGLQGIFYIHLLFLIFFFFFYFNVLSSKCSGIENTDVFVLVLGIPRPRNSLGPVSNNKCRIRPESSAGRKWGIVWPLQKKKKVPPAWNRFFFLGGFREKSMNFGNLKLSLV